MSYERVRAGLGPDQQLNGNVSTFNPAEFGEPLRKWSNQIAHGRLRLTAQEANDRPR